MSCILIIAGLKKWVEIGNSGVFRPELLLPMNLPKDVSVIAWGLSLERYEQDVIYMQWSVVKDSCTCMLLRVCTMYIRG